MLDFVTPDKCLVHRNFLDFCTNQSGSSNCKISVESNSSSDISTFGNSPFIGSVRGGVAIGSSRDQFEVESRDDVVRITFVSSRVASSCIDAFSAQSKSIDRRSIARGCHVKAAPSPGADMGSGQTRCSVDVSFDLAESTLEKDCFVQGVFWGDTPEIQVVRIMLK